MDTYGATCHAGHSPIRPWLMPSRRRYSATCTRRSSHQRSSSLLGSSAIWLPNDHGQRRGASKGEHPGRCTAKLATLPSTVILVAKPGDLIWRKTSPFTNSTALSPSPSPSAPAKEQIALRSNSNTADLVRIVPSDADHGGVRCVPEWDTHVVFVTPPKHRIERWRGLGRPVNLKGPHAVRRRFPRNLRSRVEHGQMRLTHTLSGRGERTRASGPL